jgi:hypothetical protein
LKRNFVHDLDDEPTTSIDAFEAIEVRKGEKKIKRRVTKATTFTLSQEERCHLASMVFCRKPLLRGSLGELALLYTCPRAATVMASAEPTKLFRVDQQTTFRHIMESKAKQMNQSSVCSRSFP